MRLIACLLSLVGALVGCARRDPILQIAPRAECREVNGDKISFSTASLSMLFDNITDRATPVPIILSHGKGPHGDAAAGWLRECEIRKSGLWCTFGWTEWGRSVACHGQYRYVSPSTRVVKLEGLDDLYYPFELVEVSLTNLPAIEGMAAVEVPPCPVWQ